MSPFRVWFENKNEWEKDSVFIESDGSLCHFSNGEITPLIPNIHIVEFYTKLNDKNKAMIFEGDLLKVPFNEFMTDGIHEVYFDKDGYVTSSVKFSNKETANKHRLLYILSLGAYKIGNIHENKELLSGVVE